MIYGVGTDIVDSSRIDALRAEFGEKFAARVLTEGELEIYKAKNEFQQKEYLLRRFAAKEAVAKAFGVGIGGELSFHDIEVMNDDKGKPVAKVGKFEDFRISISISDEKSGYAIAFAVVEKLNN